MNKHLIKHPFLIISIVVLLTTLPSSAILDISIMEARNFVTAEEILKKNNWLLPTLNNEPRYQKPPLPTWITAVYLKFLPTKNLLLLRLPTILMLIILSISSYLLMLKLTISKWQSIYAALILSTSLYVFALVTEAPWDIYAHGFLMLGILCFYPLLTQPKLQIKNMFLSAVFIALSILSKGPISIYIIFIPFLVSFLLFEKNIKLKQFTIRLFLVLLIAFVLSFWWLGYVLIMDGNNFTTITNQEITNWKYWNVKPWYYYWNFFIQSGIWALPSFIALLYFYILPKLDHVKTYKLTFWWTIFALILLSVIPEKKVRYTMPLLIPLALNTSFYINYCIKNFTEMNSFGEKFWIYFNYTFITIIALIAPLILLLTKQEYIDYNLIFYAVTYTLALITGIYLLYQLYHKNISVVFNSTLVLFMLILLLGISLKKDIFENPNFTSINKLKLIEHKYEIKTYAIGEVSPEILWYNNADIPNIYLNEILNPPTENTFGLLTRNKYEDLIKNEFSTNFNLKKVATFDFNKENPKRKRLIKNLYIVSKIQQNNENKTANIN